MNWVRLANWVGDLCPAVLKWSEVQLKFYARTDRTIDYNRPAEKIRRRFGFVNLAVPISSLFLDQPQVVIDGVKCDMHFESIDSLRRAPGSSKQAIDVGSEHRKGVID